jgi:hypothetical protein
VDIRSRLITMAHLALHMGLLPISGAMPTWESGQQPTSLRHTYQALPFDGQAINVFKKLRFKSYHFQNIAIYR